MLQQREIDELVQKAVDVLPKAYCIYSNFPVGAALMCETGDIFVGVNVENASFGGTICAERSAVMSAVSSGHRRFKAIAVVTKLIKGAAPCGMCRQVMVEFGNFPVFLASSDGQIHVQTTTHDLLPYAFTPSSLQKHEEETTAADSKETSKLP